MTGPGTKLPFPSDISNGRSCHEPTFRLCHTGIAEWQKWTVFCLSDFRALLRMFWRLSNNCRVPVFFDI